MLTLLHAFVIDKFNGKQRMVTFSGDFSGDFSLFELALNFQPNKYNSIHTETHTFINIKIKRLQCFSSRIT